MSRPIIEVENLTKCYRLGSIGATTLRDSFGAWWDELRGRTTATDARDFWALRDVSFSVQPGEVVGVIGRNGAGKSTLLKILSRITEPTSGRAVMRGRVASLLEVGTGFHPDLTGRENIFLNGAILGMTTAEVRRKFDEIVAFSEVEKFIDTPVKRYSSGMYVRLAFAVAAHLEPEILIIDEVLAVGDAQFQRKCLGKMREVSTQGGRTVLFVSHNMDAISALCTQAVVLAGGRVAHTGNVVEALRLYGDQHENAVQQWSGPLVDEALTLQQTWVRSLAPSALLDCGEAIEFGLRYEVHRPVYGLIVGYQLFSEYGYELIYSLHDDTTTSAPTETLPGHYETRFTIPANVLAAGSYRVTFDVGVHNVRRIISSPHGDLGFELTNASGIGLAYIVGQSRGYKSILRPNWPVQTRKIGSLESPQARTPKA